MCLSPPLTVAGTHTDIYNFEHLARCRVFICTLIRTVFYTVCVSVSVWSCSGWGFHSVAQSLDEG